MVSTQSQEQQLREDICRICELMYTRGIIVGPSGNVSARMSDGRILLTPGGLMKNRMAPDQLIVIDMNGELAGPQTEASRGLKPSSELPLHLEVYRNRPDVGGVVHAHPSSCVALSNMGISVDTRVLTEGMLFLGVVATARYGTPTTTELSDSVVDLIPSHDAVILPYHGSITVGEDVWKAYSRMEVLEQVASIQCTMASMSGERKPLGRENIEKMIELRKVFKHELPSDSHLLDD